MDKIAWGCDVIIGTSYYCDFTGDLYLSDETTEEAIKSAYRNQLGMSVEADKFPKKTIARNGRPQKLRHFANAGFFLISPEVIEVLKTLDIGEGAVYPTSFFKKDQKTPLNLHHSYLNIGNVKDTFLAEQSPRTEKSGAPRSWPEEDRRRVRRGLADWADDDVALGSACLEGPDIWVEKCFNDAFFISDRFAQALLRENLAEDFNLKRCRVL
ncbi:hypothetical protein [uncultured Ruegeria sp.]|uniref:hypothetical protein n=1 Tax=uncultured Ruegeria sp. TaxID=259304 RepID=UPI00262BB9FC|nr:hypothetical protein [uncultured Ruegeria sp.]